MVRKIISTKFNPVTIPKQLYNLIIINNDSNIKKCHTYAGITDMKFFFHPCTLKIY